MPSRFLEPPSLAHPIGTDAVGMDIFSRVIYAPRIDLTIAVAGTAISAVRGQPDRRLRRLLGMGAAGCARPAGHAIMRAADVLQAFPVFAFALVLVAVLGQSVQTVDHRDRLRQHSRSTCA